MVTSMLLLNSRNFMVSIEKNNVDLAEKNRRKNPKVDHHGPHETRPLFHWVSIAEKRHILML